MLQEIIIFIFKNDLIKKNTFNSNLHEEKKKKKKNK